SSCQEVPTHGYDRAGPIYLGKWPAVKSTKDSGMTRREWLQALVGLSSGAAISGCSTRKYPPSGGQPATQERNPIEKENKRSGTNEWMLTNARIDPKTKYRCPWIEGYCSRTSVQAGDSLHVFVSTNPASEFTLDIFRMGFYGGDGGREVLKLGPFKGG